MQYENKGFSCTQITKRRSAFEYFKIRWDSKTLIEVLPVYMIHRDILKHNIFFGNPVHTHAGYKHKAIYSIYLAIFCLFIYLSSYLLSIYLSIYLSPGMDKVW